MKKMNNLEKIQIDLQYGFSYREFHGLFNGVPCQYLFLRQKCYKQKSNIQFLLKRWLMGNYTVDYWTVFWKLLTWNHVLDFDQTWLWMAPREIFFSHEAFEKLLFHLITPQNQLFFTEIPNIAKLTQLYGQSVKQGLLNQHQIWYWDN